MWNIVVLSVVVVVALVWAIGMVVRRITIYEYQHALLYRRGRFAKLLEPGIYWLSKLNSRVDVIDSRPRVLTIPGQEVLSSDGVSLKVSTLLQFRVIEPTVAQLQFEDYLQTLYAHAQTVLRKIIGDTAIENILENRSSLSEKLDVEVKAIAKSLGLEIVTVTIKDIMFPGVLKEAFSQVARAKQEGLAGLERARGESAAMRNLANTAKLLENNPYLYRLRLLQTIDEAGSVILRLGSDVDDVIDVKAGTP